jgi:lysophospholipase L1-like esterase
VPSLPLRMCRVALLLWCATAACQAQGPGVAPSQWVGAWASSQAVPSAKDGLDTGDLHDVTLRQVLHLSLGGDALRLKLSNVFGTEPLHISSVHVARPLSASTGQIDAATDRALSFAGRAEVTVPAGAEYLSDPLPLPVAPFTDIAVSLHLDSVPAEQTSHIAAHQNSFLAHGDQTSLADLTGARKMDHWFFIAGAEVAASPGTAAIVALGDSITDGTGTTTNGNDRWLDDFARKLALSQGIRQPAVLNAGIGGNRLLVDGRGPSAVSRFDREVLAQPAVRYLIVLEGINDLRRADMERLRPADEHEAHVRSITGAYKQFVLRAHAHGILVMGATITPDMDAVYSQPSVLERPSAAHEADRQAINRWIRTSGCFDAVVDFDAVVRDPGRPDHLLAAYDSGDHIHPSPSGYQAMADAIPLSFFSGANTGAAKGKASRPARGG